MRRSSDARRNGRQSMTVKIKQPNGTEITLTGPGAEVCVALGALLDSEKPGAGKKMVIDESGITLFGATLAADVQLTGPEWDKLTQLYTRGYRYLARDDGGALFAYQEKPFQKWDQWQVNDGLYTLLPTGLFTFVRIEDEEPTEIAPITWPVKKEATDE